MMRCVGHARCSPTHVPYSTNRRSATASGAPRTLIGGADPSPAERGIVAHARRVGAESPVRPAQATIRYSWTSPPRWSVRRSLAGLMP
jgi:hypothetical protein